VEQGCENYKKMNFLHAASTKNYIFFPVQATELICGLSENQLSAVFTDI
jgi:hypothetical protein